MKKQSYGEFILIPKPLLAYIDPDLAQELTRERIEAEYSESEIEAISKAGLAGASAGDKFNQTMKDWGVPIRIVSKSAPLSTEELLSVAKSAGKLGKQMIDKARSYNQKPEPMKNSELIEKAKTEYPKGTKFIGLYLKAERVSDGEFGQDFEGNILTGCNYVYLNGKWATVIPAKPDSILSGKCAIRVDNERLTPSYRLTSGKYAKEEGIKAPVFVLKSEDDVDLYVNDGIWTTRSTRSGIGPCKWNLPLSKSITAQVATELTVFSNDVKAFSTKEAAEKWVTEQNKPKEIVIDYDSETKAVVNKSKVVFQLNGSGVHFTLTDIQLSDVYAAIKYLQL